MNSKTYLHKLESDKYLEFKQMRKLFILPLRQMNLLVNLKSFKNSKKKLGKRLI